MKIKPFAGLFLAFSFQVVHSQIVINEIDSDNPGTDALEFVELYDGGSGNTSLSGHVLVFFNGSDDASYAVYDLDGQTTDANGFFLIGSVAGAAMPFDGATNQLQNGADAVALFTDVPASFPNDTPATTTNIVDAIVYGTSDGDDGELLAVFGGQQIDENENSLKDDESIQRNPDGSTTFSIKASTPGATNFSFPELTVILDPTSIGEADGLSAIFGEVLTPEVVSGDLTVNIAVSDGTELSAPVSVTILSGSDSATFFIDAVDDALVDGVQVVDVTVSATNYESDTVSVFVSDDDLALPDVVINEMQVKASGEDPQFVELYNNDSTSVDISGWSVKAFEADTSNAAYGTEVGSVIIPASTTLDSGEFYLIGDAIFESIYGVTPDLAAEPGFSQFSVTMILFDSSDNGVYTVLNAADSTSVQANNAGAATVADVSVSDGAFSPAGFYLDSDGGSFASLIEFDPQPATSATPGSTNATPLVRLRVALDSSFVVESDGAGVITATVTRVNDIAGPLNVTLASSDTSELVFQATSLSFAAGEAELTVLLDAVDDPDEDGAQEVVLTASATGYIDGTATATVGDDESVAGGSDILFTQIYEGAAVDKHVEITNVGSAAITLNGWTVTRWTNAGTEDWKTATSGASGTFLLDGITLQAGESLVFSNTGAVLPSGITSIANNTVANFNGDDSMVLYNGALNPANIADALSFTDLGNEGANTSFVRASLDTGWDTNAGSNITDYPSVWTSVDTATVDAAVATETNYLGFFELGAVSNYIVAISDCSAGANQFVINFNASGTSDVYVSTDLMSWTLATNGEDVASGTYTDTAPPAGKAFYLIQEANAVAP